MKKITLTSIAFIIILNTINAQISTSQAKTLVKNSYGSVYNLINAFEINKIDKANFIEQLYILLAYSKSEDISVITNKKINTDNSNIIFNYLNSNDIKIFKTHPPKLNCKISKLDSTRYNVYCGINYLYSMKDTSAIVKFTNIDSIIKVVNYVNDDTLIKFSSFPKIDKDRIILKTISDCLDLRDDYLEAKQLGYENMTEIAKLTIRNIPKYKGKKNYYQYFDYIDKLKKQ